MMVAEPDDLQNAQFSLHNPVQCDSTLLASITTGRFVTLDANTLPICGIMSAIHRSNILEPMSGHIRALLAMHSF